MTGATFGAGMGMAALSLLVLVVRVAPTRATKS
jgi:hypothetical protein